MTVAEAAPGSVRAPSAARTRILDSALGLMSERGAAGTSMRRLADACGLNVATIYHYFPSKADVLRAVIEERRYGERTALARIDRDRELVAISLVREVLDHRGHERHGNVVHARELDVLERA